MASLTINGRDIAEFNCIVTNVTGWSDRPSIQPNVSELASRVGAWVTPPVQYGARELTASVLLRASSVAARKTELNALYAACRGVVELTVGDDPSRFSYAMLASAQGTALGPALAESRLLVELRFVATDPYFYDVIPSSYALARALTTYNDRRPIPLGTAPSGGVIRICGSTTSPFVINQYGRVRGTVIRTMTISQSLTTGEWLEIDCDQYTITKWNNTTSTNVLSSLGSTETFFRFDPAELPRLATNTNAANGGVLYYRRAWLT